MSANYRMSNEGKTKKNRDGILCWISSRTDWKFFVSILWKSFNNFVPSPFHLTIQTGFRFRVEIFSTIKWYMAHLSHRLNVSHKYVYFPFHTIHLKTCHVRWRAGKKIASHMLCPRGWWFGYSGHATSIAIACTGAGNMLIFLFANNLRDTESHDWTISLPTPSINLCRDELQYINIYIFPQCFYDWAFPSLVFSFHFAASENEMNWIFSNSGINAATVASVAGSECGECGTTLRNKHDNHLNIHFQSFSTLWHMNRGIVYTRTLYTLARP